MTHNVESSFKRTLFGAEETPEAAPQTVCTKRKLPFGGAPNRPSTIPRFSLEGESSLQFPRLNLDSESGSRLNIPQGLPQPPTTSLNPVDQGVQNVFMGIFPVMSPAPVMKADMSGSLMTLEKAGEKGFHGELRSAILGEEGTVSMAPSAPARRIHPRKLEELNQLPLIKKAKEVRDLVAFQLFMKKNGDFQPFDLKVTDNLVYKIHDIEFLGKGQHSNVYKCTLEDGSKYVVKVFQDILDKDPGKVIEFPAGQLYRYCQNKENDFMKEHTAEHFNFTSHYDSAKLLLSGDVRNDENALRDYVKAQDSLGFVMAEYIEGDFPVLQIDRENLAGHVVLDDGSWKNDPVWVQLKEMFAVPGIYNDIRRSNVKIDEQGTLYLVDLYERFDESAIDRFELVRTFTSIPEVQKWLCPDLFA
ncbi:MAG: hypothetical protein COT85_05910 [Chlamydiae bacterium CG10_big_fil_rev_8_21_14_0_10_42_34]|nr:MAG: hypothetical protein COT85_05910 [Chlamydiae bacterium CG10_big_fil_rev_8_21_14_0_10_42_34]